MSRYVGSVCRLCRREGEKLFLKGNRCYSDKCSVERRQYPPGVHGTRRMKISDYGVQLREKQKVKRLYGLLERPMVNLFKEAVRMQGITGDNFLSLLERRLDNVVYRMGMAASRKEARQLVRHGHFQVNNKKANYPSIVLRKDDVVRLKDSSRSIKRLATALEDNAIREIPAWLEVDKTNYQAVVKDLPRREDLSSQIEERLIVELYSK